MTMLILGLLLFTGTLLYVGATYNDLAGRLERLRGLTATARATRGRRFSVGRDVRQHVRTATTHERGVTRLASRRGGRGGSWVRDNGNGWPECRGVGSAELGLKTDVESAGLELSASTDLHREAEAYNALLASFPALVVGRVFRFRPWRLGGAAPAQRGRALGPGYGRRRR